jgi:hypothetical protein
MADVVELRPMKLTEDGGIDWTQEPATELERAVRARMLEGWLAENELTGSLSFSTVWLQLEAGDYPASDFLSADAISQKRDKLDARKRNQEEVEAARRKVVQETSPVSVTPDITPSFLLGPDIKEGPAACKLMSYNQAVSGYKKTLAICGNIPSKSPLFLALMPVIWAMHDRAKATAPSEKRFDRDMG